MISFMISSDPAQILVTRASIPRLTRSWSSNRGHFRCRLPFGVERAQVLAKYTELNDAYDP